MKTDNLEQRARHRRNSHYLARSLYEAFLEQYAANVDSKTIVH
jgi:hypothetical protein